jgi:foldase protein PrsA
MIAKDRGREVRYFGFALGCAVMMAACPAWGQQADDQRYQVPPAAPRVGDPTVKTQSKTAARPKVHLKDIDVPGLKSTPVPVNPTDAIIIVNGQVITRQQLADECVARKGKEISEMLINRVLVEQALRARKLEVTGVEIDQEIEQIAHRFGIGREGWLRTLDKERGISPVQYARDIIYPAIALRKLCAGRVQVTPSDLQNAFEGQFGDKLRCRMILVDKQNKAVQIWEELRKNPGGFEKMAQEQSLDTGSRGLGGLLGEPITRHAYPTTISDAAFQQLVDGDPTDRDPSHKPKDGDFTGPIQAGEMWMILRRESVIPGAKGVSLKDERVRKQTYEMIYEVKLKETMGIVFQELVKAAAIENQLTGTVKLANEEKDPNYGVDKDVELMSNPPAGPGGERRPAPSGKVNSGKLPPPAALSQDAAKEFDRFEKARKAAAATTNATPASAPGTPNTPN